MEKLKIGVFGIGRGIAHASSLKDSDRASVVAICEKRDEIVEWAKLRLGGQNISFYKTFDEFIAHDMDVVVLANYAPQHAPYAIRCLEKGLHVISELVPFQTMKEAVELAEAVDKSGKVYAYAENCCYMLAPVEMKRLYKEGRIGEFRYGECEYLHTMTEEGRSRYTYGDPTHWRNNMYSTFYCTHSLGPIIHATGLRPVSVTGFELPWNSTTGRKGSSCGIEMVTLENGAIIKSTHGSLTDYSLWWTMYGTRGAMESERHNHKNGDTKRIYINPNWQHDETGTMKVEEIETYEIIPSERAKNSGHGGSDYNLMDQVINKINGDDSADIIDFYEACDMFLPGMFAYRSLLNGGIPMEIPNLRDKAVREEYRNDTMCTDPEVAGDMLIPSYSKGNPDIPDSTYERIRKMWDQFAVEEKERIEREIREMRETKVNN